MVAFRYRNDRNSAHLAAGLVGYALDIRPEAILAAGRSAHHVAKARHIAMYLAHIGFGMSLARVATAFERDRSTVAHACRQIEDKRDDAAFDQWLETLEQGLVTVAPLSQIAA